MCRVAVRGASLSATIRRRSTARAERSLKLDGPGSRCAAGRLRGRKRDRHGIAVENQGPVAKDLRPHFDGSVFSASAATIEQRVRVSDLAAGLEPAYGVRFPPDPS